MLPEWKSGPGLKPLTTVWFPSYVFFGNTWIIDRYEVDGASDLSEGVGGRAGVVALVLTQEVRHVQLHAGRKGHNLTIERPGVQQFLLCFFSLTCVNFARV